MHMSGIPHSHPVIGYRLFVIGYLPAFASCYWLSVICYRLSSRIRILLLVIGYLLSVISEIKPERSVYIPGGPDGTNIGRNGRFVDGFIIKTRRIIDCADQKRVPSRIVTISGHIAILEMIIYFTLKPCIGNVNSTHGIADIGTDAQSDQNQIPADGRQRKHDA